MTAFNFRSARRSPAMGARLVSPSAVAIRDIPWFAGSRFVGAAHDVSHSLAALAITWISAADLILRKDGHKRPVRQ